MSNNCQNFAVSLPTSFVVHNALVNKFQINFILRHWPTSFEWRFRKQFFFILFNSLIYREIIIITTYFSLHFLQFFIYLFIIITKTISKKLLRRNISKKQFRKFKQIFFLKLKIKKKNLLQFSAINYNFKIIFSKFFGLFFSHVLYSRKNICVYFIYISHI